MSIELDSFTLNNVFLFFWKVKGKIYNHALMQFNTILLTLYRFLYYKSHHKIT